MPRHKSPLQKAQAMADLKAKYPQALDTDWVNIFNEDPVILGQVLNDLLKPRPKKYGRRLQPEWPEAYRKLHQMTETDEEDNEVHT